MSYRTSRFTLLYSAQPAQETTWRPAADVYRTKDGWLLKFELAGVSSDDIRVHAQGSALTVGGVRRDVTAEENCCQYSMEIPYSRFERTIHLPCNIDSASIDIEYGNGILLVRLTPIGGTENESGA